MPSPAVPAFPRPVVDYFADLDELFEMTARRTLNLLRNTVDSTTLDLDAPTPDVIRTAYRGAAVLGRTHGKERRAISGKIVVNLRNADGSLRLGLQDYDEEMYGAQEAIFRRGQTDGYFRSTFDPRLLAVHALREPSTPCSATSTAIPNIDADNYAATVAAVLLDGIIAQQRAMGVGPSTPVTTERRLPGADLPMWPSELLVMFRMKSDVFSYEADRQVWAP